MANAKTPAQSTGNAGVASAKTLFATIAHWSAITSFLKKPQSMSKTADRAATGSKVGVLQYGGSICQPRSIGPATSWGKNETYNAYSIRSRDAFTRPR